MFMSMNGCTILSLAMVGSNWQNDRFHQWKWRDGQIKAIN